MKNFFALFLICTQLFSLSGCASIVSGKKQDLAIRSNPPGADVLIDGTVAGTTPMITNLVRKRRHEIQFKKDGYPDITKGTTRGFNWWYTGNIIFGGIIGLIVDPITGAMYKIKPQEIFVDYTAPSPVVTDGEGKKEA